MRAVLDANVLVSAVLQPIGNPALILDAWRSHGFDLLVSDAILAEVDDVLRRPRLRRRHGWTDDQIEAFVLMLGDVAIGVQGTRAVSADLDDPDDAKYLACAVAGGADYLVSGDNHLLTLIEYEGIRIVSPAVFRSILDK